jgi:hypothetical protein
MNYSKITFSPFPYNAEAGGWDGTDEKREI